MELSSKLSYNVAYYLYYQTHEVTYASILRQVVVWFHYHNVSRIHRIFLT